MEVIMVLKRLRKSFKSDARSIRPVEEEYIEIDVGGGIGSDAPASYGKMGIRIETLSDFGDTEKVLRFLRDGSIVMLRIKSLKEKDLSELKRAVERLKRTILAQNGDMVGVEQDWLLLVPEHVIVHR